MTVGPWIGLLLFGGGVCLAVGLIYLGVASRREQARVHLWLGLLGLLSAAKAIAEARLYTVDSTTDYGVALQWQLNITFVWAAALVWFVAEYVGGLKRLAAVLSVAWLATAVINGLSPASLVFTRITDLRRVTLPWGEQIAIGQGPLDPLRVLLDGFGLLMAAFSAAACVRAWRRRPRRQAVLLAIALGVIISFALVHGYLVDTGLVELPYLVTPAVFLMVLMMSVDLGLQVRNNLQLSRSVIAGERRWRSLLDNARLLIAGLDRQGRIEFVNAFLSKALGYRSEEIVGKSFLDLAPAKVREETARLFTKAIEGEPEPSVETRVPTRDGDERIVVWRSVHLHGEDGAVSGLLSVGADVTDRRRAESARDAALSELKKLRRQLEEENLYLREEIQSGHDFAEIVGDSDALRSVLQHVQQVAPTGATVVIQGETGVGKELIARAIHDRSPRRSRPFVRVNCGALAPSLAESEIFGHEAGAFTGARGARQGRFEVADGGTLFLDEIGELPLELQPKLLRVLHAGELERVGSSTTRLVDVRVLTATHRDLGREVAAGRFRQDLYYRLNVYPLTVPPLRERREDIPLLVRHYVPRFAKRLGKSIDEVPAPLMRELTAYDWPGNVRELLNILERAVITSPGPTLRLPDRLRSPRDPSEASSGNGQLLLAEVERRHIVATLETTGWRISGPQGAAKLLGLNPSTLRGRMRKLGVERP